VLLCSCDVICVLFFLVICSATECSCDVHLCSLLCCSSGGTSVLIMFICVLFTALCAHKSYDQYAHSHIYSSHKGPCKSSLHEHYLYRTTPIIIAIFIISRSFNMHIHSSHKGHCKSSLHEHYLYRTVFENEELGWACNECSSEFRPTEGDIYSMEPGKLPILSFLLLCVCVLLTHTAHTLTHWTHTCASLCQVTTAARRGASMTCVPRVN
jgi:hypothetical protein